MSKVAVIAGVPVDVLSMSQALDRIEEFIASGKPHQIATVNADFVVKAWDDPELRDILHNADLLTADGMPLVWGAKLLGIQLEGRVTGVDLVAAMAARGAQLGWRFYLLGGREGVATRAAAVMTERYPGLKIVGIDSPPLANTVEMPQEIVDRVRQANPDVLLVAFGNPKQDKWIHMHSRELGVPVSIGVGGTLDFISGETKRAPMWMQRSGLEWLYRLLQEPRRLWKRYAVDLVLFSRLFWKQYWIQRKGGESVEEPIEMEGLTVPGPSLPNMTLSHSGNLTATNSQELLVRVLQFLDDNNVTQSSETNSEIILDLSDTSFIDSAGMGVLVQATRRARARGSDLRIVNLQPNVNSTIQLLRLDAFLTVGDSPNVVSSRTGYTGEISKPSPDVAVLKVPRRLDVSNVHQVIQPYGLNPDSQDCPRLIMDFSDTRFVDSASIAALLKLQKVAGENGCRLELAQVDREVRRSFDLAGAGDKFIWLNTPIPTTLEKAQ